MPDKEVHRQKLIHILQMAYSGEKAAALAYAGHWRSLPEGEQRRKIAQIESEEWEHRRIVGVFLAELGASPQGIREVIMSSIGSCIFIACFLSGWYLPMYFAGRLERDNVDEYLQAAAAAEALGLYKFKAELLRLAEVELEHEVFFKTCIAAHRLTPLMKSIFKWGPEEVGFPQSKPVSSKPG